MLGALWHLHFLLDHLFITWQDGILTDSSYYEQLLTWYCDDAQRAGPQNAWREAAEARDSHAMPLHRILLSCTGKTSRICTHLGWWSTPSLNPDRTMTPPRDVCGWAGGGGEVKVKWGCAVYLVVRTLTWRDTSLMHFNDVYNTVMIWIENGLKRGGFL